MKDLYYIGEVSALLGISAQTLRYYDKIGVVQPASINELTGYRQYTYDQVQFIERVRYLQNLGLSLTDIQSALASSNPRDLIKILILQKEKVQEKKKRLQDVEDCIDWYIDYYRHLEQNPFPELPFKVRAPERYILAAPILPGHSVYGSAGHRLTKEKCCKEFAHTTFLRQNGYILDFAALMEGAIQPSAYFIYIKDRPTLSHPYLRTIPAGEYLCIRGKILTDTFDPSYARQYFQALAEYRPEDHPLTAAMAAKPGTTKPLAVEKKQSQEKATFRDRLVIANEYEDNFHTFMECVYEIQILLDQPESARP